MARRIVCRTFLVVLLALSLTGAAGAAPPHPATSVRIALPIMVMGRDVVNAFPIVTTPDPVIRWMVDQVHQETVRQYEGSLTGEWPVQVMTQTVTITNRNTFANPPNTPIRWATQYVGEHLAGLGLDVEYHRWGPETAPNVIGQKTGLVRPGDIYMVTAHLDDQPSGGIAPGADDNASGSTAVLVAADVLSQFEWNCTLRFALWTGEEAGLLGSDKYALRASNNKEHIVAVLNLDMIGWNTPGSLPDVDLHARSSRPRTVDLAYQAASVMTTYGLNLIPDVRADGVGSSDHASFWKYGYDAILGIEDYSSPHHDFDPYYHTTGDKLATLDMGYFTEYVKAAVAEAAHMANCLVTGSLGGKVTAGPDGAALPNASVALQDAAGRTYSLQTGADGRYSQAVPPETYTVTASASGYVDNARTGIVVSANGSATQDFVLAVAAPATPTAAAALVQ